MSRRIDLQPRIPMVKQDGAPTNETLIVLQEIAKMLRDLEERIIDLEAP